MTKREICERLIKIYALAGDGQNAELVVCDAIRGLLLDLAAPEEEKCESPKETRPLLVTYNDAGEKRKCPQCGQLCMTDLVSGQFFCRTYGSFKLKEATNGKG